MSLHMQIENSINACLSQIGNSFVYQIIYLWVEMSLTPFEG